MNAETRKAIKEAIAEVFGYPFDEGEFKMHQEALDRIAEIVKADRPRLTVEEVVEMWIEIKPLHSVTVDYLVESGVSKFNVTVDEKKITDAINAILDGKGK